MTPYLTAVGQAVDLKAIRKAGLRVLFDAMHGAAGTFLKEIVGEGQPTTIDVVRAERNPCFGGVHPEPIPENLGASRQRLSRERYDVALSSDGDGDRLGVLAPDGTFVTPHRILALLAEDLARRGRLPAGSGIAKTFSTSMLVDRVAKRLAVPLFVTPIGFKFIADRMRSGEVGIGGEESGGLGVSFFLPERDGLLSALLVLEAIAHSGVSFEALLKRQEAEYGSFSYGRRDLRLDEGVIGRFLEGLSAAPPTRVADETVTSVSDMDGVKLHLGDRGWLLHRRSGTEPLIRIYAEHEDPARVEALLEATERKIRGASPL